MTAAVHDSAVLAAIESLRPQASWGGRQTVRLTYGGRSVAAQVTGVTTRTTTNRTSYIEVELKRDQRADQPAMTASFSINSKQYTAIDLAELDLKAILFNEERPRDLGMWGGQVRDFTMDLPDRSLPTATFAAVFGLLATEALIQAGRAQRVQQVHVAPPGPNGRRITIAWTSQPQRGTPSSSHSVTGVYNR